MFILRPSLREIDRHPVQNAVDVVDLGDHAADADLSQPHGGDGVEPSVKEVPGHMHVLERHVGRALLRSAVDGEKPVVPAAQRRGGAVLNREFRRAVHNAGGGTLPDRVFVCNLGGGLGDDVEHQRGGDSEKLLVIQSAGGGPQEGGQPVRQSGEGPREKAGPGDPLDRNGCHSSVDKAVELPAGGEGQLHLAPIRAGNHAAPAAAEKEGGGGAAPHGKAHGDVGVFNQLCGGFV